VTDVVEFTLDDHAGDDTLRFDDLPAVRSVRQEGDRICLSVTEPHIALPALLNRLQHQHRQLASLTTRHASLEDVFVTLTGRHLRDDEEASPS